VRLRVLNGGGDLGNREVPHPELRAKRADLEEGARGGTWFPRGSGAELSDVSDA
jgi:hypothetical protein